MNLKTFKRLVKQLGLKKAMCMVDGDEVVDADGNAVEIEAIDLITADGEKAEDDESTEEEEEEEDSDDAEKRIASIVAKTVGAVLDSRQKAEMRISGGNFRNDDSKKHGFNNFGDFAKSVMNAGRGGRGNVDKRLLTKAPTTYSNENAGVDGGFAVPPEFIDQVRENTLGEDSLLSRTDNHITASNNVSVPVDVNTDWDTSSGIQADAKGEASQFTQSKVALTEQNVRLHKVTSLVPVTDELLEDSSFLGSYLARKAGRKIDFEVSRQIVNGTGNGELLGILNAPCTVSVAKVSSQDATSFVATNVIAMWSRLYGPHAGNAVWLINQDVIPQLHDMSLAGKDATGTAVTGYGSNVYSPANGLADAPFGTLYGRPVIPHQACSTLGSVGDVILADLSEYMTLTKAGGIQAQQSGHLYFDYDLQAFKFTLRVGGQPWWPSTISALNGSATYSPFVTTAVRA